MASLCGLYVLFVSFFTVVYGEKLNTESGMMNICLAEGSKEWSYNGKLPNGPPFWGWKYPMCYGRKQSPIAIVSKEAERNENLAKLTLNNYDKTITKGEIKNNGHTIETTPNDGTDRTIFVNGTYYSLRQFHFHWGDKPNKGSEHTLDGTQYAMEMHLVHMSASNEIAVVGIFFKEQENDHEELQKLVKQFNGVRYEGNKAGLESDINLNNLLPANPTTYFRYQGSLTTPPCTEGVTWSVVPDPMPVGRSQMNEFRKLYSVTQKEAEKPGNSNCKLVNNYRPIQPLNGRQVYLSP